MKLKTLPATRMKKLESYFFARANAKISQVTKRGVKVINLGIGSPDLIPHKDVLKALTNAAKVEANHRYPGYAGLPRFKNAIKNWYMKYHGVDLNPDSEILPVAGSKQGLIHLSLAIIDRGDEVLVPNPGYQTYHKATFIAGGKVKTYPLTASNNYLPDLKKLGQENLSKVKMMWINYPHNPTGSMISKEVLKQVVDFALEHNILIVSDNPYSHVTFNGQVAPSILEIPGAKKTAIEFHSMSKTYNMAGWRVGWLAGNSQVVKLTSNIYSNIETGIFNCLQEAAATALTLPKSWINKRNRVYQDRIPLTEQILRQLECGFDRPTAGLYIWAKLPKEDAKSENFCFDLLEKTGVFVAPGTAFGSKGEGYIRISLCQPKSIIKEALERIKKM